MTGSTIAAIATAPGRGGVGIIRVSGPASLLVAQTLLGFTPQPRYAHYCTFKDSNQTILDQGIALFFPGPYSFTGEDILELQGHGGPVILDCLLSEILALGVHHARPGEFSERAFLNDKLDLAQAEAIADLIDASSAQAAKQALNSLKGAFSKEINQLVEQLIHLRIYVEAAIDFPEEEVDFLGDGKVAQHLGDLLRQLNRVIAAAEQGALLREGMKVVIAGRPNAGKSSLLNALAGSEVAIVTPIAGTTRDLLKEHIHIDGLPLHIVDTAGLRDSPDEVERIGIARAWEQIHQADRLLLIVDATAEQDLQRQWPEFFEVPLVNKLTLVFNKADQLAPGFSLPEAPPSQLISAKTGWGLDKLKDHLKQVMHYNSSTEGGFSARRRHLQALHRAREYLINGQEQLQKHSAGELLAEDLKEAQNQLGQITGSFTPDDLLGRIFADFCIGK